MIYTRKSYVSASMCDGSTKLSVIALFQLVEDAVTELMGDLHLVPGPRRFLRGGFCWLLRGVFRWFLQDFFHRRRSYLDRLQCFCG